MTSSRSSTSSAARKAKPARGVNGGEAHRLDRIARRIGGVVVGDGATRITGVCGIREAKPGDLTFVANSRYLQLLESTRASAAITSREVRQAPIPIIQTENPSLAFARMAALMSPDTQWHPRGVSPRAVIAKGVKLGRGVAIQPFAVVEAGARIGDRTVIYAGCYIGRGARIGNDCLIYPNVSIREKVEIGHRVIIHCGSVVGSDGFGFATVKGTHHKIPQTGSVVIEDDVEIGAGVTIDRARFGRTVVGKGTKIDNLVQIAHNVVLGSNCLVAAQTGIAGSVTLGSNVVLGGQAGVVGHITIGDNVRVGAKTGVTKDVPSNSSVWGYPAKPLAKAKRVNAAMQRLPELYRKVELLEERLRKMQELRKE